MLKVIDDRRRELFLARPPARIVSLVPSDTETLFAIGAGARVVGRTEFCEEPADRIGDVPTCGGTKNVDIDAVAALAPDIVLANQEENTRAALEQIAQRGSMVYVSHPRRVGDAIAHVARVARMLGIEREAEVASLLRRGYEVVREARQARAGGSAVPIFVPIWMEPLMTIGGDTYGSDMLALAGGANVYGDRERYPRTDLDEIRGRAPELALLPDEPHAFSETDAAVFREIGLKVQRCDGKDLFWYGARTVEALPRLAAVLGRCAEL
jgi:ABC-type Fe3+-hydroxamate transport system substrate-binding protein